MSLRRNIRQAQQAGVYSYAILEAYNLGLATVRLAKNGARLSNLPVTGSQLNIGDVVIVDYSSGTPPTVRPVTVIPDDEEISLELAEMVPEKQLQEMEEPLTYEAYWVAGDHGVKAYQWGGTYTTVFRNQWTVVRLSGVDWDSESETLQPFWDPYNPDYITVPAPGYYMILATVAFSGGGTPTGWYFEGIDPWWGYPSDAPAMMEIAVDSNVTGRLTYARDYPIARDHTKNKIFQAYAAAAKIEALERVYLKVNQDVEQSLTLVQEYNVTPSLTLQWIGNYES